MCWSFKASLTSFILGSGSSLYLIYRNGYLDRVVGYIMLYITSMQGLEALMWMDQKCTGLNQLATKIAIFQNLMQPFVAFLVLKNFYLKEYKSYINLLMLVYGFFILFYLNKVIIKNMNKKNFFCTNSLNIHHLQWNWVNNNLKDFEGYFWLLFSIALVIPMFFIKNRFFSYFMGLMFGLSLLFSMYYYKSTRAIGSWWCVLVVLIPIIKVLLPEDYFRIK